MESWVLLGAENVQGLRWERSPFTDPVSCDREAVEVPSTAGRLERDGFDGRRQVDQDGAHERLRRDSFDRVRD